MGWENQGWAEFDALDTAGPIDPGPADPRPRGARLLAVGLGAIAMVALGCLLAGQLPRHHPLVPALSFALPHLHRSSPRDASSTAGSRTIPLGGPTSAIAPSTYTLHGRTASTDGTHATGDVVLRGRWNHGAWLVLATARIDAAGNFRVASKLRQRGLLELRLLLPDGVVGLKTLHVS